MENVVILGSGNAGLTAAIYAARANLKPLVIAGLEEGGQLMLTTEVENFPGFPEGILGPELIERMRKQAERFGARFLQDIAQSFEIRNGFFEIKVSDSTIQSKTVIVATGASARFIGLDSEKKYVGRGVSTCATCLPEGSNIIANSSPQPIENVVQGQMVLTHDGSFQKVVGIGSRQHSGKIIKILPRYFHEEITRLTPEHPVLVTTLERGTGSNYWNLRWSEPNWLEAGDIKPSHILLYPIVKEFKDVESLYLSQFLGLELDNSGQAHYKFESHSSRRIPDKINVDNRLMRLIGYFLAEGTVTSRGINLYFGSKDKAYVEDTIKIIEEVFNYKARVKVEGSVYRIECYAGILRDFFMKVTGKYSYAKSLPHWFVYLPLEKQAELIKGYWRGDGGLKEESFCMITNSPKLVAQMKIILLRLGIIPRIQKQSKESLNKTANILDGRKISFKHDRYQIEIGGIWLKRASEVFGVVHPSLAKRKRRNSFGWIKDNFAYLPISKIEEEPYEGKVYNLAVENNNSYTTSGAAVHNCDGYFFTGKEIIVVGGGDSACEEALFLTRFVDKLTIVHRKGVMRASKIMQDRVMKNEKISFLWNHVVEEVEGDEVKVTGVKLKDLTTGELTNKKVDGVFIAIGHDPNTKLFRGKLDLDEKGYLKADKRMHTNIAGVFAAGDVHDTIYRQAITASAMGCMAAIEAEKYLEGLEH